MPCKDVTELHYNCPTASIDSIRLLWILRFFEVLSLTEVQVEVLPEAEEEDANTPSLYS
jgi:hypothetical protein